MTKTININEFKKDTVFKLVKSGILANEASVETDILLNFAFGITKKDLILNPEKELLDDKLEIFNELIEKRIKEKIPVQYLTHKAYFMGEEFYVDENVLIPRPETEILVEEVLKIVNKKNIKILDVGTGSGCIACMLAKKIHNAQVFACDISEKAIKVAEFNTEKLNVKDKITFVHSDLFKNIDINEQFDVIVSNPPYIPLSEKTNLQQEVVLHEPHSALFTEDDKGISFYEKLVAQSKLRLNKNGYLAVEIGIYQSADVVNLFAVAGFNDIKIIKDYNQIDRVIIGKYRMS